MNDQPELRIGDSEREAAVTALGEHYAAGRLTKEEYDERAGAAWAARTGSQLMPLFADLPRLVAPGRPTQPAVRQPHPGSFPAPSGRAPRRAAPPLLPLIQIAFAVAMLIGGDGLFWVLLLVVGMMMFSRSRGRRRDSRPTHPWHQQPPHHR